MHNQVQIRGPATAVFDLVTSARFWPQWHHASRAVAGVTQRPYQLGDIIYEHVSFGNNNIQEFQWRVAEHIRPVRVVLQADNKPARITYAFAAEGSGVLFTRVLEYDAGNQPAVRRSAPAEERSAEQPQRILLRLKELVESILATEARGLL